MADKTRNPGEGHPRKIWEKYQTALDFNQKIHLNETVEDNENFFIGKQWEGVKSNGLPTPVFNFLKRDVLFSVASNTSDNIKISASLLPNVAERSDKQFIVDILNAQFEQLFEHNKIAVRVREFMRNAAVDGDGATFTWWDEDAYTGQENIGAIRTEIIENTRVLFGNPNDRRVQNQPWIIVVRRERVDDVKERAKDNNVKNVDDIRPDSDDTNSRMDSYTDDKVTVLLFMRRDKKTKEIKCTELVKGVIIRKEWSLGIRRYPITWTCWDYIQDSYHGQAMLTGLLSNQQFVNKMFAMVMVSLMRSAFPKIVYDKSRIKNWTSQVGAAIGIEGGDTKSVASIIEPTQISPQVSQVISSVIDYTQSFLGATSAALGDTRPDNTSAIIALQRASSVPMELTKQNMYDSIEDLGLIYLEFMAEYYGKRTVELPMDRLPKDLLPDEVRDFVGGAMPIDAKVPVEFDFSELKDLPVILKLDVGASAYWSEIASMQTLDSLLMQGKISTVQYLERVPDGYIPKRQELISELKMQMGATPIPAGSPDAQPPTDSSMEVVGGRGYGGLQRAINETGEVPV